MLILFNLITFSNCKDKVSFTVKKIKKDIGNCLATSGDYYFYIEGDFSNEEHLYGNIIIYLKSPSNAKVKCIPFSSSSSVSACFQCNINICIYPLERVTILLPTKPPTSSSYDFPNWEEYVGSNDGISNLVEKDAVCLPSEKNIFIPSSLKSDRCAGNLNIFEINGDWQYKDKLPEDSFTFEISLLNDKKDIIVCDLDIKNINQIKCEYEGEGEIKFGETYFKGLFEIYKIEKNDLSINVGKCESSFFKSNFFYMMGILIMIFLI